MVIEILYNIIKIRNELEQKERRAGKFENKVNKLVME